MALYFREDAALLGPPPGKRRDERPTAGPRRDPCAAAQGACFFTDLLVDVELAPEELQEALWDLVWAGEVTNDAFAPLRAPRLTLARAAGRASAGAPRRRFASRASRARRRRQVQGRWSLTAPLFGAGDRPGAPRRARSPS